MEEYERALELLTERLRRAARDYGAEDAEELRLRAGRRPSLLRRGAELVFSSQAVEPEELARILERATGASVHAVSDSLRDGYVSWRGLRIGVCGSVATRQGSAECFRAVSSLAVRIPRECRGLCEGLADQLYAAGFQNTLILSPPGGGKTTALRDLIRCLSEKGKRIAVVDERNELSATEGALPRFDLGPCADVMVGLNKAEAAMLLLRAMNPEIIAMDEITREADMDAVEQIAGCGVGLIATAHAFTSAELRRRPLYRRLLLGGYFSRALLVRCRGGERSYRIEALVE